MENFKVWNVIELLGSNMEIPRCIPLTEQRVVQNDEKDQLYTRFCCK